MPTTGELNLNQNNNSTLKDALKSTRFTKLDTEDKVISTQDNEEEKTAAVVLPIDGGWAWVVMVASFLCNTVVDGIVFSSGMIQESIMGEFKVSKGYVAIVSSLLSGCYLMAGPFVSAMANRYGFRPVTMCGAVIASIAFALSYCATSVEYLFITYGIIGGIGFCMIYIPSVITVGYYFEKWRALATGIALCGSGVGTFVFAPLTQMLITEYGWRNTLVIQAGIILLCLIFGAAYRPLPAVELKAVKEEENGDAPAEKKLLVIHQSAFKKPLPEGRFAYSVPSSAHNTYTGAASRNHYPTAAEIFQGANIERKLSTISGKSTEMKSIRKSQPTTPNGIDDHKFDLKKELNTVGEIDEDVENQNLIEGGNELQMIGAQGRRHTVSGRRPADLTKSHNRLNKALSGSRPLYRDDAFYAGSLAKIPQYTSQTSLGYHMSVTRLPTKQDIIEEEERTCKLCPEAVRRTLSTMLDTSLLKSPSFMLLACSGFLTMMGFFVPFIFIVPRAVEGNMDKDTALMVVSAIGISNTIARIVCGLLSSFPSVSALMLNNVAITVGGIFTIFSGLWMTNAYQFAFAAIFGICIACFSALRSIIAVELMGLEKLTNAFGFLMLFQGLAAAVGSPIAGVFYDVTGSYDASFYFAGGLITVSAFLCYPLRYVSAWEKRRDEEKQKNGTASP
ncbi:hypothetical protein ACFFRR_008765 [Megaselia abdita]